MVQNEHNLALRQSKKPSKILKKIQKSAPSCVPDDISLESEPCDSSTFCESDLTAMNQTPCASSETVTQPDFSYLESMLNSLQSNEFMEKLSKFTVDEMFVRLPEKEFGEVYAMKVLVVLSFAIWFLFICIYFFFLSADGNSYKGPTPT